MAFNEKEQAIIDAGKAQGKSINEVKQALAKYRATQPVKTEPVSVAEPEKGIMERVSDVISGAGEKVGQAIRGEEQYTGQSPLTRGFQATAEAFKAVPQTFNAVAPEPVRQASEFVGEKVGEGFDVLTDKVASTKLFSDIGRLEAEGFINPQDNPEFYRLKEQLITAQAAGETAGVIAGAKGTVDTLQGVTNVTKNIASKVATKSDDAFGSLVPTKEQIAIERAGKIRQGFEEQNTRLKTADKAFTQNTIKRVIDGKEEIITPIDTLAKYEITPVVEKGTLKLGDYKTGDGALGIIKENVRAIDNDIDTNLVNTGQKISIDELRQKAIQAVKSNADFKREGTVASNVSKINSRFDDYTSSYGDDIDIAELNNLRKVANKDWKIETQDTSRVIGDVARNYVYDSVPDNIVKELLQKQAELLAAKKYLEKINGSKVTGGRLGNYAMRTSGAILGSTIEQAPIIGPAIGMAGGEAVARALQQSQFKSPWTEIRSLIAKD